MSVVLTADHLPVQSRADYWRDVLGDMLGTLDPFGARRELRIGDLGALRMGELTADQAARSGSRSRPRAKSYVDLRTLTPVHGRPR